MAATHMLGVGWSDDHRLTRGLVRRHKVLIFTEALPAPPVAEHLAQRIPGWTQATLGG